MFRAKVASTISAVAMTAAALLGTGSDASAITIFLTNVPFDDGGVLNGSITTNVYGAVSSWNLVTSGGSHPSETYTPAINEISSPAWNTPITLDFTPDSHVYEITLQLTFTGDINGSGPTLIGGLGGPSFECFAFSCPANGSTRYIADFIRSDVTFTPLPATWILMIGGLLGFGAIAGCRKKTSFVPA